MSHRGDVVVVGSGAARLAAAIGAHDGGAQVSVYDQAHPERYGFASVLPGAQPPDGVVLAPTLSELAGRIGVPADALEETVARFNRHAAAGHDPDFHRGETLRDRWWGDHAKGHGPDAAAGPLDTPPFHAVETGGTKGGPRTDGSAR